MKPIHLDNFENEISDRILERGYEYYLDGRVVQEHSDKDSFLFTVEGTEPYEVRLKLETNLIKEHDCDCPYDMGPVCKHVAACLYYIKNEHLEKEGKQKKNLLQCNNPYERQIIAAIRTASDRHGFIDWREAGYLGDDMADLVEEAKSAFLHGDYGTCLDICFPLIIHLSKALENADDSNADISDPIRQSIDLMMKTATDTQPDESTRVRLMDFCLSEFANNALNGYDWHIDMIDIAGAAARNLTEADRVITQIRKVYPEGTTKGGNYYKEYYHEKALVCILFLMKRFYMEDPYKKFRDSHLFIREFREEALQSAISKKKWDIAKKLALDGIEQNRKEKPGFVNHWENFLLQVAIRQEDKDNIIRYAELLWLDGYNPNWIEFGEVQYDLYSLLKETVGETHWSDYISSFAKRLHDQSRWFNNSYSDLCIKEAWWDKLLEYVKEQGDARFIKEFEKYLKKDYREQLIEMYAHCLYKKMDSGVTGRGLYQEICSYLRRMNKLGGRSRVETIIMDLRQKYPRRPALIEELNDVL